MENNSEADNKEPEPALRMENNSGEKKEPEPTEPSPHLQDPYIESVCLDNIQKLLSCLQKLHIAARLLSLFEIQPMQGKQQRQIHGNALINAHSGLGGHHPLERRSRFAPEGPSRMEGYLLVYYSREVETIKACLEAKRLTSDVFVGNPY